MVNYYRHMCPRAAQTLGKLYEATKLAPRAFKWTPELDSAFAKGNEMLENATELVHPDPSREIRVTTDASDTGYGRVIFCTDFSKLNWNFLKTQFFGNFSKINFMEVFLLLEDHFKS